MTAVQSDIVHQMENLDRSRYRPTWEGVDALVARVREAERVIAEIQKHHRDKRGQSPYYDLNDPSDDSEPIGWESYVICDYDKTTWPCKTQKILDTYEKGATR